MSLGLPSHLVRQSVGNAMSRGTFAGAIVLIIAAAVNSIIGAVTGPQPGFPYWVALLALIPLAGLIIVLSRYRTALFSALFVLVGGASAFVYATVILSDQTRYARADLFVVSIVIITLTLVGTVGQGALVGVLWCSVGFGVGELAVFGAAVVTSKQWSPDPIALISYLLFVLILIVSVFTSSYRTRPEFSLLRAVRDDQSLIIRRELTAVSSADLHDTVLSELLAIASAGEGPLSPALRMRIDDDLVRLAEADDGGAASFATESHGTGWQSSHTRLAVELARNSGLAVEVSGDRNALGAVSEAVEHALGQAVRQCLVNVLNHSGSGSADVAVSASEYEVSVLVIDGGRGFVEQDAAEDRLGIRHSIRQRIEAVGGRVRIWSAPSVGTTIMMVVPAHSSYVSDDAVVNL